MRKEAQTQHQAEVVLLIDYDNLYPRNQNRRAEIPAELNRWLSLVFRSIPDARTVRIRLYGGWLEDGVLTKSASELASSIRRDFFPLSGPNGSIVRGSLDLVDRLEKVPSIQWAHTSRTRTGIPQLRLAESPRPEGCLNDGSCPIDLVQRISRRRARECHVSGCSVSNESAFLLREQKMVDVLLACDAIELAMQGVHVVVMSNDLDLLPGVASAATHSKSSVTLVRGPTAGREDLYTEALASVGVEFADLAA